MTSLKVSLTIAVLAVASCYAFPQRMNTADTQQLLSLLSSRFVPSIHSPSYASQSSQDKFPVQEDQNDNDFDDSNDDNNDGTDIISSHQQQLPKLSSHSTGDDNNAIQEGYSQYPLQNGINSDALMRLKAGLWALERMGEEEDDLPSRTILSDIATGRGKRFIPGLNSLMVAHYLNGRNARFMDAGKWKRQPHLGFHGSRG